MLYKIFNYVVFVLLIHIVAIKPIYAQEYIFVGDPATILEYGTYKQSFNTGMYFYHKRQWKLAIDFFKRCSELTRKKVKHYKPLTWSYIYSGEYSLAIKSLSNIKNRKERQLIRLVLKEITSKSMKKKFSKNAIDIIINDKKDIINRTKANLIAISKHEIIGYGP